MLISADDLLNLPVFTQSGEHLGKVVSFDLDVDAQAITKYHVKTGLIKDLWHEQLVVDKSQVLSISKEAMVVEDSLGKELIPNLKTAPAIK